MTSDFLWELFAETGDILAYLLYRQACRTGTGETKSA